MVVGPDKPAAFAKRWQDEKFPFVGLPDPEIRVLDLYGQDVKLLKLGRMPAQVVVDKDGLVRYAHYGSSMSDIPDTAELLALLDSLEASKP